jgi:hypothetical protein
MAMMGALDLSIDKEIREVMIPLNFWGSHWTLLVSNLTFSRKK